MHDTVKPCSAEEPPRCTKTVAEACPAGVHVSRRECYQQQQPCSMPVLRRCSHGHATVVICSDADPGGEGASSRTCAVCDADATSAVHRAKVEDDMRR